MVLDYESGMNELLSTVRSVLMDEDIEYLSDIVRLIEAVDANAILEAANKVFEKDQMSTLIFKQTD